MKNLSADEIIAVIEAHGLGWTIEHTARLIEARIWNWPYVLGRYRPAKTEPLAEMLTKALEGVDLSKYEKTTL